MNPALLLLLAATQPAILRDDTNSVPPMHWRYDEFLVKEQLPVEVECAFRARNGVPIRIELLTRANLDRLRNGEEHDFISAVSTAQKGELHQEIGVPGTFALVVFNDDESRPADVSLRLALDFSGKHLNLSRSLSPERKLGVILISFAGFFAMITFSARKLLTVMREQPSNLRSGSSLGEEGGENGGFGQHVP